VQTSVASSMSATVTHFLSAGEKEKMIIYSIFLYFWGSDGAKILKNVKTLKLAI
jgi:hypothetical protein